MNVTVGSITISLHNFVDKWITDNVRRDAFILSCSHVSMLHSPISLVNPLNYSPGEGLDPLTSPISLVNPLNYSPGEGLDPLTSLTLPHVCACPKDLDFQLHMSWYFFLSLFMIFSSVIVCFVDTGGIVDHHFFST